MSLVEQAIARLKSTRTPAAVAGVPEAPSAARVTAAAAPHAEDTAAYLEHTASPQPVISLDENGLRAAGYVPEQAAFRQFADHYRRIKRPLIEKAMAGKTAVGESRVIMVTSALPGDGKTFTSINLAFSMALERDISVLFVDCDVAMRHVSRVMGLDERLGLLDALLDEKLDIESLIVPKTTLGLSILPAGRPTSSMVELLSSNRMRKIVTSLCARNPRRILLLDSPPLMLTNEARSLVKIAGQVVLVVRAGKTPRPAIQGALALFDPQQAGGIVLNDVMLAPTEKYYGYGAYGADGTQT